MSSCWPLFIGSCTGDGETAYEGALCRGSRGLLLGRVFKSKIFFRSNLTNLKY